MQQTVYVQVSCALYSLDLSLLRLTN